MIGKIQLREEIEISFPYSPELVEAVKQIPQRRWNGDRKVWALPVTPAHAKAAINFADMYGLDVDDDVVQLSKRTGADFAFQPSAPQGRMVTIGQDRISLAFPFDPDIIEQIKEIPGRAWDKELRAWTVPLIAEALGPLQRFLELNDFGGDLTRIKMVAGQVSAKAKEAIEASKAADADFDVQGLGGTLRPFQRAGVKYAVDKQRVIIGDEMGLGKTPESLATVHALNAFPLLVVCPATLKLNWYKETRKWLPGRSIQILGDVGRADAQVVIVNYDKLKNYRDYLVQRPFKAVICDESHLLKSATAARTQYVEEIVNGVFYGRNGKKLNRREKERARPATEVRLLLTGTVILNRPDELVSQLQIIDRLQEFGGWYGFMKTYAGLTFTRFGADTSGNANLKELNDRLRATCYVRRLKSEVLTELPPKQRAVVPTEISNRSEYDKAQKNLIAWLQETAGRAAADKAAQAEQLVRIEKLKRLAAMGKMAAIKTWVEDFLESGQKLVAFAWHQEIVEALARTFKCGAIHGGTPMHRRGALVDQFQNDPKAMLLALNIQTGGVGLTLTAASNVAFFELGWNPATHDQGGDRCHRIGQTDSVTEWWFIAQGTIEEDIQELIEEKRQVVDAATDGTERKADVSVLNQLVARLRGGEEGETGKGPAKRAAEEETFELF